MMTLTEIFSNDNVKTEDKKVILTKKENGLDMPKAKGTIRGKAAMLLLDSSSESDGEAEACGIYGNVIQITKKELADTKTKFEIDENNLVVKPVEPEPKEEDDSEVNKTTETADEDNTKNDSSDSDFSGHSSRKRNKETSSDSSLSPPPVLSKATVVKKKRKSYSAIDRHFKALETIRNKTTKKTHLIDEFTNKSVELKPIEINHTLTVRVSTKNGLQRFEIGQNNPFSEIFEKLSKTENTDIENLLLTHNSKKIAYTDTALSLKLQNVDVIVCEYIKSKVRARIEIIDKSEEIEVPLKMVAVILQTRDGRKSRVKFIIAKDEPLLNMLPMYCDKLTLSNASEYIIEFDGEIVGKDETANDLDLDGDEIFDVKKSNKPTMQIVSENKKNYEFDDDLFVV